MIKFLEEFNLKGYFFRYQKMKTTELLALMNEMGKQTFQSNQLMYEYILSHVDVKIENQWQKLKDGELFFPPKIEEDYLLLQEITLKFINEYLSKAFHKSTE